MLPKSFWVWLCSMGLRMVNFWVVVVQGLHLFPMKVLELNWWPKPFQNKISYSIMHYGKRHMGQMRQYLIDQSTWPIETSFFNWTSQEYTIISWQSRVSMPILVSCNRAIGVEMMWLKLRVPLSSNGSWSRNINQANESKYYCHDLHFCDDMGNPWDSFFPSSFALGSMAT